MTNEEQKKMIMDVINATDISVELRRDDIIILADALIAAGIGDVSELKKHRVIVEQSPVPTDDNCYILPNTSPIIKQLYSGKEVEQIAKERDEYKHRAEVAERALLRACKVNTIFAEPDVPNILAERVLYEFYIRQSEKELEEDGKE